MGWIWIPAAVLWFMTAGSMWEMMPFASNREGMNSDGNAAALNPLTPQVRSVSGFVKEVGSR
jgi:hypothetical protein